ncbi:divergent polysaccharide deacetylase family protein [Xenorhabdus szentirmaii]|uniref:divergent polysaccharide deacetylase family protein n=1 Tax=Xenorhabdus szentirmaii TaxID=290112 RepID=UPI0032B76FA1
MIKKQYSPQKPDSAFTLLLSILLFFVPLLFTLNAQAARLAIVIDDVGYRVHEENKILQMPVAVSIAILPDSPYGRKMAEKAHQQGREILIHLPMAPLSKQPLEKNTLHPAMTQEEISRIIQDAIQKVPHATGMNNHMGSAMTSNLSGMEKVMQVLSQYHLYFLDSVTIGNTQVTKAAMGTTVPVLRRNIFLDNVQTEAETRQQINRAIALARKQGAAIAIGHPHPTTMRVLQQTVAALPRDIELVSPSMLLHPIRADKKESLHIQQTKRKCAQANESKFASIIQWDDLKALASTLVHEGSSNALRQYLEKHPGNPPKQDLGQASGKKKSQQKSEKAGIHKTSDTCPTN